jgi:hypothetical protein
MVIELNLPVEHLVSLHKLQRLNYVNLFGGCHDQVIKYCYKSTNKGKEFLKPKPVRLDIHALQLMVLMYKQESLRTPTGKGALHTLNWLNDNTRFVYPDCTKPDHWTLSPLGEEFINDILNKELLFI